jgi:hypothetical protein
MQIFVKTVRLWSLRDRLGRLDAWKIFSWLVVVNWARKPVRDPRAHAGPSAASGRERRGAARNARGVHAWGSGGAVVCGV